MNWKMMKTILLTAFAAALAMSAPITASGTCPLRFTGPVSLNTGVMPGSVATGDFNRDGELDMALTGYDTLQQPNVNVRVFLGQGAGRFAAPRKFFGLYPDYVVVADMNRDGKQDLVLSSPGPGAVSVLLGDGTGGFGEPIFMPGIDVATEAPGLAGVADLNRDGKLDVILPIGTADVVGIGFGDGAGGLSAPLRIPVSDGPVSLTVNDFNRDGALDFVTANQNLHSTTLTTGDGFGQFVVSPEISSSGYFPITAVSGDLNRDGILDVVLTNSGNPPGVTGGNVAVLFGQEGGGFVLGTITEGIQVAGENSSIPFRPTTAIADFDRDARLDIAVAEFGRDRVTILKGNGDGTFQTPLHFPAGDGAATVTVDDFNSDGRPDLAVGAFNARKISFLLSACK
jgi:FG-GAP-like repeat